MIYVAMFDEIDEGTAIFKCTDTPPVTKISQFIGMDGKPSDHYLWLTGKATQMLRKEIPLTKKMPNETKKDIQFTHKYTTTHVKGLS